MTDTIVSKYIMRKRQWGVTITCKIEKNKKVIVVNCRLWWDSSIKIVENNNNNQSNKPWEKIFCHSEVTVCFTSIGVRVLGNFLYVYMVKYTYLLYTICKNSLLMKISSTVHNVCTFYIVWNWDTATMTIRIQLMPYTTGSRIELGHTVSGVTMEVQRRNGLYSIVSKNNKKGLKAELTWTILWVSL